MEIKLITNCLSMMSCAIMQGSEQSPGFVPYNSKARGIIKTSNDSSMLIDHVGYSAFSS